jgi:hypothetical protein
MSETPDGCDIIDQIIDYESGTMEADDVPDFFQRLYDTGVLTGLQGSYYRVFVALEAQGLVETR